jgi:hypothetical protein
MSDSTVQTPTEGSGPKIDCELETKGGQTVERQRVQAYFPDALTAQYIRPADTAVYTSGDQVADSTSAATALAFALGRFNGGGGVITGATIIDDSNPGTKPKFELWLFNGSATPTPNNDNVAIAWSDADVLNCIGVIEFLDTEVRVGGANTICQGRVGSSHVFELPYRCAAGVSTIWGMLVVRSAYTPANAGKIKVVLNVRRE